MKAYREPASLAGFLKGRQTRKAKGILSSSAFAIYITLSGQVKGLFRDWKSSILLAAQGTRRPRVFPPQQLWSG